MNFERLAKPFVDWWGRFSQRPVIAHLLRALDRYLTRMGEPLSAAITYYSVLSLVPMLMFALAVVGMVLTLVRPDLLGQVQAWASISIADPEIKTQLDQALTRALFDWRGLGLIALVTAGFAGVGWVGGLKGAVRAQFRTNFDSPEGGRMVVWEVLHSLAVFVGLLVAVTLTFGVSSLATNLADLLLGWLGFSGESRTAAVVLRVISVVTSLASGWALFYFLFRVLPMDAPRGKALWQGSAIGSVGLAVLQYATQLLFSLFASNLSAAIFGPVIALMLFFNLFARLTLYCAAWIATWQPKHDYPSSGTFQI